MREVLFRGKTKALIDGGGYWAFGSLILATDFTAILEQDEDDPAFPYLDGLTGIVDGHVTMVIPDTIGQYTGLKDKNGKMIFEGDILAIKFFPGYVERVLWDGPPDAIAKVFWDLNAFSLDANGKLDKRYADFCDINYNETEIIGNIHDNPELLKGES